VNVGITSGVEDVQLLGDRYRLVERLGGGGMSVVWRAYDEVLGRQVAVKVMATQDNSDASREWIRTEAQAAARLTHPHITGVHDYGESLTSSGMRVPYVVMELVPGQTLEERLKAGPLPPRTAMLIGAQVAAGLAAAHARGLVHRDVKPGNVMLSPAGAKLMDFGIAAVAGEFGGPLNGRLWGTPAYLAPERLGGGDVIPATDVYALGLLLYRVLAGSLPWRADTVSQMIKAHQYTQPMPLPELADVPDEVSVLCRRCLSKRPDERPTAAEVARVLAAASGWHVAAEAGTGDLVVGALAGSAAALSRPADSDAETLMVPLAAAVAPPTAAEPKERVAAAAGRATPPTATSGTRRRRAATALASAIVLLTVALLAGFCTQGRLPGRPTGPAPGAAGPTASGSPGASAVPSAASNASTSGGPASSSAGGGAVIGSAPGTQGAEGPGNPGGTGNAGGAGSTAGAGNSEGGGTSGGGGNSGGGGAPNPAPTPVDKTVTTPGGTVTCRCVGPTATLVAWNPLPGFTPTQVNRGPAPSVGLVFHAVATDVRVTFRCRNGGPEQSIG
jgi:hypothetical protein